MSKKPKPDYRIEMVEKKKPKPPTVLDILYESMVQAVWFGLIVLLAMRIIGEM